MLRQHLEKYFNFSTFRPGQEEIVQAILKGSDVVALMPTGGGKSLCFQLPALLHGGLTVVISPLIALMKDQVDGLNARGISAAFINSSLPINEIQEISKKIKSGNIKLLYVAPERLSNISFKKLFIDLEIAFLAVDEAHCVSQWGHDFRPDYLFIQNFIAELRKRPIVGAFTATATPEVREDIVKNLALKNPHIFIRGFDRPNLKFFVQKDLKRKQRTEEVLRIIKTLHGSGIVYTISRKETEEMAQYLSSHGISSVAYHAGLESGRRTHIQNEFMENKFKVIVATIAFGMGVDKADIRFVIHAGMPSTMEGYYQEAGRAGRDGEEAYCILLHSGRDNALHHFFIQKSREEMSEQGKHISEIQRILNIKYNRLEKINDYVASSTCRRKKILEYFADPDIYKTNSTCAGCDVCMNFTWQHATPHRKRERLTRDSGSPSGTVLQTVDLYQKGYTPEAIAKARSIGVSTVLSHLAMWYSMGGELDIRRFVSVEIEKEIEHAIKQTGSVEKLKPIKDILPEYISYDHIRFVIAKRAQQNNKLT